MSKTNVTRWMETCKDGVTVLRSPAGQIYYGTAAEVRDAGLSPWRRKILADGLRCLHRAFVNGVDKRSIYDAVAGRRRKAVLDGVTDLTSSWWCGKVSLRDAIRLRAVARAEGVGVEKFVARRILGAVAEYEARHGGWLKFDRYEAAALARMP